MVLRTVCTSQMTRPDAKRPACLDLHWLVRRDYGRSGLPCSDLPCSGLLLECCTLSCCPLECGAGARSACELPRDSLAAWFLPRESGAGRASRVLFGLVTAASRFPAFAGRSLWLTFLFDGNALPGRSPPRFDGRSARLAGPGRFAFSPRAATTSRWKSPGRPLAATAGRPWFTDAHCERSARAACS